MFLPQAPLTTPVTEDVFSILTEKHRIPVPILPGKRHSYLLLHIEMRKYYLAGIVIYYQLPSCFVSGCLQVIKSSNVLTLKKANFRVSLDVFMLLQRFSG